jgi:uncharacterized protein DUF3105
MRRTIRPRQAWPALALAALLGGCGGTSPNTPPPAGPAPGAPVPNEGWAHVPEGSAITYQSNPPASGPHYPVWLRYQEYSQAMARGYWVHNLEHGAIVVLYRPDAPAAVVREITEAFRSIPPDSSCGHQRALLTPDPLLPRLTAVVAADWVLLADSVDAPAIRAFGVARRGHGPEQLCDQGTRP